MTATVESGGWLATLAEAGTLPMRGSWLAPAGRLPDTVEVPSNVLLLRGHGRTILVDTAAGERAGEWPGAHADLSGVLAGADVSPEQVDAVLLTHLDFDHCGGIVQDGVPVFPRARVLVMRDAADWASDADDPGAEVVRTVAAAASPSNSRSHFGWATCSAWCTVSAR